MLEQHYEGSEAYLEHRSRTRPACPARLSGRQRQQGQAHLHHPVRVHEALPGFIRSTAGRVLFSLVSLAPHLHYHRAVAVFCVFPMCGSLGGCHGFHA